MTGHGDYLGPRAENDYVGTNEPPPVENWRIFRRLIGHDNDVQDLGWSYDSSILVSVGLDSKVVVWSGHTFEKLKTLSNHHSHVKGLTFDPANKYFATASDDRSIKIFRFTPPGPNASAHDQMNNFMLEQSIIAPFSSSPLTTYFRRCSWSPDGNHIAAANAVNGPVSSVAIINRGTWDSDINLIGHEGPVEVCAFSPRLFTKEPPPKATQDGKGHSTPGLVTVIACAGQDKALSVWITSNPRPLVITQDLAAKSISDLAWTPDGKSLFATSLDGSVIAVVFEDGDLGYGVGLEENEKSLAKFGAGRRGVGIIEGTDGLLLEEKSKQGELKGVEGRMGALMGDSEAKPENLANGTGIATAMNGGVTNGAGAAAGTVDGETGRPNGDVNSTGAVMTRSHQDLEKQKIESLKSRVTYTKDGRRRIAPMLVSTSGAAESSLPSSRLMAASASNQGAREDAPQSILDLSKPFDGLPRGGLAALLLGNKRKLAAIDGDDDGRIEKRIATSSRNGAVPILANTVDGLMPPQSSVGPIGQQPTPDFIRPAVLNPSLLVSQVRLAVPKVRVHILRNLKDSDKLSSIAQPSSGTSSDTTRTATSDVVLEARNPSAASLLTKQQDREPSRVTVTRRGQSLWQDYLPRCVLLVTGSRHFWSAACEDGSVYVWTPAGRRLVNAMVMEAQPVILECRDWWLLCITAVGMCYVWDIRKLESPHPPVSLAPILDIAVHGLQSHPTHGPAITSARLNSEGRIVVTLSTGDGYSYSPTMYTWQRLSEVWWAVGSQYWNTTDSSVGNIQSSADRVNRDNVPNTVSAGIIPHLERNTTNEMLVRGRAYALQRMIKSLLAREGFEGFESGVSIAHLETRVAGAMLLGAKEEFRIYLEMYAKRLGAEGLKLKVGELLKALLGGISQDSSATDGAEDSQPISEDSRSWYSEGDELCGWPRRELLRSVILILGMCVGSEFEFKLLLLTNHRQT